MKIGRNDRCLCGSGRKFKKCCLGKQEPVFSGNVLFEGIDLDKKERVIITDTLLENQIYRDGPKIAESFDKHYKKDIKEISAELSRIIIPFYAGKEAVLKDPVKSKSWIILLNAQNTIVASVTVLRHGHKLQPGILIRSVIESIGIVASFIQDPANYKLYVEEKLESSKAVSIGKKILPLLGHAYGLFSKDFAHIGRPHNELNPLFEFKEEDDIVRLNLEFIKLAVHFMYVLVELLCYDSAPEHRYWERIEGGKFRYCPSEAERDWQKKFLGGLYKEP